MLTILLYIAEQKHMELDIFFLREKVLNKSLTVSHVPAHEQWTDILTKPLSANRFLQLRDKLRIFDKLTAAKTPPVYKGYVRVVQ